MSQRPPAIFTERTILQLPRRADAAEIQDYVTRNRSRLEPWEPERDEQYYSIRGCVDAAHAARDGFRRGTSVHLCAWDLEHRRIVARCNFSNIIYGPFLSCFLGYSVDGEAEGQGMMHEVVRAGIDYMFCAFGLHRIQASYLPRNERSARLLDRLGFVRDGYVAKYLKIAGRWEDHVQTSLINDAVE